MSKQMIYNTVNGSNVGDVVEVWGVEMRTQTIDDSMADEAVANGWHVNPQAVLDIIEGEKLKAENTKMEDILKPNAEIEKLKADYEAKLSLKDAEIEIYKLDKNGLKELLTSKDIEFSTNDTTDDLRELALADL